LLNSENSLITRWWHWFNFATVRFKLCQKAYR